MKREALRNAIKLNLKGSTYCNKLLSRDFSIPDYSIPIFLSHFGIEKSIHIFIIFLRIMLFCVFLNMGCNHVIFFLYNDDKNLIYKRLEVVIIFSYLDVDYVDNYHIRLDTDRQTDCPYYHK